MKKTILICDGCGADNAQEYATLEVDDGNDDAGFRLIDICPKCSAEYLQRIIAKPDDAQVIERMLCFLRSNAANAT